MQDLVLAKGTPANHVRMISIWSDTDGMDPDRAGAQPGARTAMGIPPQDLVVMYSGNFGIGHDARTILPCDVTARRTHPALRFEFVGGGKHTRSRKVHRGERPHQREMARICPAREKLGPSLAAGDIHLISLKEGVEGIMVPSKLMGIMAVGRASIS